MTVYGGEETVWGTKSGGFFVSCTKCGWHSEVELDIGSDDFEDAAEYYILFTCGHCNNKLYLYRGEG